MKMRLGCFFGLGQIAAANEGDYRLLRDIKLPYGMSYKEGKNGIKIVSCNTGCMPHTKNNQDGTTTLLCKKSIPMKWATKWSFVGKNIVGEPKLVCENPCNSQQMKRWVNRPTKGVEAESQLLGSLDCDIQLGARLELLCRNFNALKRCGTKHATCSLQTCKCPASGKEFWNYTTVSDDDEYYTTSFCSKKNPAAEKKYSWRKNLSTCDTSNVATYGCWSKQIKQFINDRWCDPTKSWQAKGLKRPTGSVSCPKQLIYKWRKPTSQREVGSHGYTETCWSNDTFFWVAKVDDSLCPPKIPGSDPVPTNKPNKKPKCSDRFKRTVNKGSFSLNKNEWKHRSIGKRILKMNSRRKKCMQYAEEKGQHWMLLERFIGLHACYLSKDKKIIPQRDYEDGRKGFVGCYEKL